MNACRLGMAEELLAEPNEAPLPPVLVLMGRTSLYNLIMIKVRMEVLHMILVSFPSAAPPRRLFSVLGICKGVSLYAASLRIPPLPYPPATTPDESEEDKRTSKRHQ